jgi:hypothetical protein
MGYLTTFRGLFGSVLEAFHSAKGLQPKDLLQALQATVEERKKLLLDGVFVPNRFTVHISRKDMAELRPLVTPLIEQLSLKVGDWIAHKGYATLSGSLRIEVVESAELAEDEVYIEAVMEERSARSGCPGAAAAASAAAPTPGPARPLPAGADPAGPTGRDRRTVVIPDRRTVVMNRPMGQLRIMAGRRAGQSFTLSPGETTLGRGPGAQLVLEDDPPYVSRTHCVIRATSERVTITDLDSTNGLAVNGGRVREATLQHLDVVHVGSYQLQFLAAGAGELAQPAGGR